MKRKLFLVLVLLFSLSFMACNSALQQGKHSSSFYDIVQRNNNLAYIDDSSKNMDSFKETLKKIEKAKKTRDAKLAEISFGSLLLIQDIHTLTFKNYDRPHASYNAYSSDITYMKKAEKKAWNETKSFINAGSKPSLSRIKTAVRNYFKSNLLDINSAKIEYTTGIEKSYYDSQLSKGVAWGIGGRVNAKNLMGAYVGYKPFVAYFRDGAIRYMLMPD